MATVGRVVELWRYPVKGLLGERVPALEVDARGAVGDRRYAIRGGDGRLGSAKSTRRFRRMPDLLSMRSRTTLDGSVVIDFEAGATHDVTTDEAAAVLSRVVGEPVALVAETDVSHLDDGPIHILTTASLDWLQARLPGVAVDCRRFRPNVLVECAGDGLAEERWLDRDLVIGEVRLRPDSRVERCVTPALAQEELPFAPSILRELERANDFCLGVYASVGLPGRIALGAPVEIPD